MIIHDRILNLDSSFFSLKKRKKEFLGKFFLFFPVFFLVCGAGSSEVGVPVYAGYEYCSTDDVS
jgi:hypothetical protein